VKHESHPRARIAPETPSPLARSRPVRLAGYALTLAAPLFFAVVALALGKEAGWDFQNYHWYDPYALLHGRLGFDIAVAHHATYYNPFLDVPLFVIARHLPAWAGGAWLGAEAGIGAALLGAIAWHAVPLADRWARLAAAAALALAGMFGGGTLGEIGKTSDDIAAGLGVLAALLTLVACFDRVVLARAGDLPILVGAGFLAGASPGLKLTTVPYVAGLALALLTSPGGIGRRLARTTAFGVGVLFGVAIVGGYWFWTMQRFSGNPIFPYFNDFFASPLVPPGSYRDPTFLPKDGLTRLLFPFVFSLDSLKVAEWRFRDIHIAIAYVLIPAAALCALMRRQAHWFVDPLLARLLLVFAAGTYVAWLILFAIYRYLIPLEMLSPLIIVAAISLLPLPRKAALGAVALILVVAQAFAWKGDEPRFGWAGRYVEVAAPAIPDPAGALVLMTETAPMAYVIPSFPPETEFLRIQGWLIGSKDDRSGFGRTMHARVAAHAGALYALYWPVERDGTVAALADYGLTLDDSSCRTVATNIQAPLDQGKPLLFCKLTRIQS
jgi:hypothetical protein